MTTLKFALTNETENHIFSEWEEPLEDDLTRDQLYRLLQREYGRCTGKIYRDKRDGPPEEVGWFFISKQRYTDTDTTYLRGTWVTVKGNK